MSAYTGRVIAFGTKHGKEQHVGPPFASVLGAHVLAPPGLDTDQFGTFSGEVPRTLTPLDAARAKARLAIEAAGTSFGMASEGSYGALYGGFGPSAHEELLLFTDVTRDIEVTEIVRRASTTHRRITVGNASELDDFLGQIRFPRQAVIVRSADGGNEHVYKGITAGDVLASAVAAVRNQSSDGRVVVETDLRAHYNPDRQEVLAELGRRLAVRLTQHCQACDCPGFGKVDVLRGLPCSLCGAATNEIRADIHGCARCTAQTFRARPVLAADPQWCDLCNP
ncbi:MAG: DUF6671 family protein [Lacisediminihabitans sp.]